MSYALSSIYFSYDDDGENSASFASLAAGLCVLCHGSKSTKLSSCFHLFDSDGDGFLTLPEVEEFLASFLRILLACSFSTASQRQHGQTSALVNATCELIAEDICQGQDVIDFQRFGDWYNDGGFKVIPWIELIDLSKWVKITAASALTNAKPAQSLSSDEEDDEGDSESDEDVDEDEESYDNDGEYYDNADALYPNYARE